MRFGKRGEKELQLIFGVFILLIITIVVVMLFLKTLEKGGAQLEDLTEEQVGEGKLALIKAQCQNLCDRAVDENNAIEFCAATQTLESSSDVKSAARRFTFGKYTSCSTKIPCFLFIDNCQEGTYTAQTCKDVLLQDTGSYQRYAALVKNVNSNQVTDDDGCNLPTDLAEPSAASNWKLRYEYVDLQAALAAMPP